MFPITTNLFFQHLLHHRLRVLVSSWRTLIRPHLSLLRHSEHALYVLQLTLKTRTHQRRQQVGVLLQNEEQQRVHAEIDLVVAHPLDDVLEHVVLLTLLRDRDLLVHHHARLVFRLC